MRIAPPGTPDERVEPRRGDDHPTPPAQRSGDAAKPSAVAVVALSVTSLSERTSQAAAARAAHVAALREQVAAGKFVVDLARLADRMLADEGARAAQLPASRE